MIERYNMHLRCDAKTDTDWIQPRVWLDGAYMRAEDVLEFLRQLEDTLPDYTDGTYDNDQICDVAWVKTMLQEELE